MVTFKFHGYNRIMRYRQSSRERRSSPGVRRSPDALSRRTAVPWATVPHHQKDIVHWKRPMSGRIARYRHATMMNGGPHAGSDGIPRHPASDPAIMAVQNGDARARRSYAAASRAEPSP